MQVETVHAVLCYAQGLPPGERDPPVDELVRVLVCALEAFDPARPVRPAGA